MRPNQIRNGKWWLISKEKKLIFGDIEVGLQIAEGNRLQLIEGAWDATGMLLEGRDEVREVADKLPYITGF